MRIGDHLRNFFYPTAIFALIAVLWVSGWSESLEAKANVGYWSAANSRLASQRISTADQATDSEHESQVASVSDGND